jgi:hypothetical protein
MTLFSSTYVYRRGGRKVTWVNHASLTPPRIDPIVSIEG